MPTSVASSWHFISTY